MNEQEWLASREPRDLMFAYRDKANLRSKKVNRMIRLFGCSCCRRIWHLFSEPGGQHAIEVAEHFADGVASEADLKSAHDAAYQLSWGGGTWSHLDAYLAAAITCAKKPTYTFKADYWDGPDFNAANALKKALIAALAQRTRSPNHDSIQKQADAVFEHERKAQANLLRDVLGNPFRPVAIDPAWLTWNDATIPKIAQTIYDERRFADMPVLADALEEAGCTDADILNHCRQPGEHVRGCWVVDLLLGKS